MNQRYRFFLLTVGLFAVFTAAFYGYSYLELGTIWVLVVPAISISLLVLVPVIWFLLRRQAVNAAGLVVLIGLSIAYAGNELVWQGLTIFNLIGGVLLVVLTGNFVLPRRFVTWFGASLFYVGLILLINLVQILPFTRLDISNYPVIFPFSLGANLLLGLAILAQILVEFQARSIRTRLLATFVLLVFLPVTTIGALTSLLNASNAEQRVLSQLESVVTLKSDEIDNWLKSLDTSFRQFYPADSELALFARLFSQPVNQPVDAALNASVDRANRLIRSDGLFSEIFWLTPQGRIVLSTLPNRAGLEQGNAPFFQPAKSAIFRSGLYYSPTANENVMIIAGPIFDDGGTLIGLLGARVNLDRLQVLMAERSGLGATGETFLVTSEQVLLSSSQIYPEYIRGRAVTFAPLRYLIQTVTDPGLVVSGSSRYIGYHQRPVLGYYRWMPGLNMALFAEQQQAEALASTYQSLLYTVLLSVISVIVAFLVGLYAVRRISQPLDELAATAQEIAGGNLDLRASSSLEAGLDEIGKLARAFNSMTGQVHDLVEDLENRVAERTSDLEKRSLQLQLAAETARDATSLRELDELLRRSCILIGERFGYTQTAIYLLDSRGEASVLAAGHGGGLDLPERLKIERGRTPAGGPAGLVVEVTRTGEASTSRIGQTYSQAALPLRAAGRLLGVLLITQVQEAQSEGAFDRAQIQVLQIVADQLAISIDSARLLRQTQETLGEMQVLYGAYTANAWRGEVEQLGSQAVFHSRGVEVEALSEPLQPGAGPGEVVIPLRLREQEIGKLRLRFDGGVPGPQIVEIYQEMANRLALLLENARLLHEAQTQAAKEQKINQIASQVRSSINLEAILRSAVRELGASFGVSRTFIQISPAFSTGENGSAGDAGDFSGELEQTP